MTAVSAVATEIGTAMTSLEGGIHAKARVTPGLRILDRFGWTRFLRLTVAAAWLLAVLQVGLEFRPDLLRPAEIGSDSSNYVAAAERAVAGHPLYALQPGDRPVPLDNAPDWSVPILSPPTIATVNLWTVLLPGSARLYPVWFIGLAGTIAAGLLAAAFAPPLFLVLAIRVLPGLAITAWSGNVNALIAAAVILAWWGVQSSSRRWQTLAGVSVAVVAIVKLGPALLGLWVLTQRRWAATIAMVATAAGVVVATALLLGPGSFAEYVTIVRAAAASPSELSIPGILHSLGANQAVAAAGLPIVLGLAVIAIVLLRSRPEAFLVAVAASIFATSVVRYEAIGIVLIAGVAWAGRGILVGRITATDAARGFAEPEAAARSVGPRLSPARSTSAIAIAAGIGCGVVATAASLATGGAVGSSLSIANESDRPILVRFGVTAQEASFGYRLAPRSTGVAWRDLGGLAPPVITIWTESCQLIAVADVPTSGGAFTFAGAVVRFEESARPAPLMPYAPDCQAEYKALRGSTIPIADRRVGTIVPVTISAVPCHDPCVSALRVSTERAVGRDAVGLSERDAGLTRAHVG